ncbi:uncharacterized protein LOC135201128 [Macrobrachium nipponense]|uniref:uncharacterized protein LOC135201128 n=1 Tax=Macrobrachium nipponense TaxID=159736 RepID=UPI0030C7A52D
MVENCTVNIFSAYAPQIGCSDEEKDRFWSDLEEEMEKVPADERCLVGGDLNGHEGQNNHVISRIHGGYGYDERNAEEELTHEIEDVDEWWNRTMEIILRVAREILGESSGKMFENKETWWFSEEVKEATKQKREAKERWEGIQMEEDWMTYKEANKLAKKTVAIAKDRAYDQLFKELHTKEGQGKIFKLAHMRNKSTKDVTHIRQIKDNDGNVLRNERDIIRRWKEYSEALLNEENERFPRGDGHTNCGPVTELTKAEVRVALGKMKNSKAVGPDGIPAEAWKALDEEGIDILWQLMKKIMESEMIPRKWRESILISIIKEKGDIQCCENYRGIKLMSHTLKVFERIIDEKLRQQVSIGRQ